MKSVRYDSEARAECLDAVRWYARRNVVAARRFDEHVVAAETAIRFPFAIVCVERDTEVPAVVELRERLAPQRRAAHWYHRSPGAPRPLRPGHHRPNPYYPQRGRHRPEARHRS